MNYFAYEVRLRRIQIPRGLEISYENFDHFLVYGAGNGSPNRLLGYALNAIDAECKE